MTGHWIFTVRHYPNGMYMGESWRCSECGHTCFEIQKFPTHEKFCHTCGAEMAEEPKLHIKDMEEDVGLFSWE